MRFNFGHKCVCTYCGDFADCIDHTIPYSYFRNTGSKRRKIEAVGFLTPACAECNTILGDRIFSTFQERFKYVQYRLRLKYKKHLKVIWDEEDLSGISGRLKQYVEQQNRLNKSIQRRLEWPETPEFASILEEACKNLYYNTDIPSEWKEFLIDTDWVSE